VFVGEVTKPETLRGLCDDIDVVFSSIGIRHLRRRPTIWDVDCQGNLNLIAAAEQAGVADFIFLSVLHGPEMRRTVPVAEARERVVDALARTKLHWAVLRPTGFFNDMKEFFAMARAGRVWLVGDGRARVNPIHGADIAAHVVDLLEEGYETGHARDLGGPDTFSLREIGELAFRMLGRPPRFGRIPVSLLRAAATLSKPFNQDVAAIVAMFAMLGSADGTAPESGTHHLEDWYRGADLWALAHDQYPLAPCAVRGQQRGGYPIHHP
jgi:uncharacterized protein YbjT (DUF2867 family)